MSGKWIQRLQEAVPKLARAAVLWDPATRPKFVMGEMTMVPFEDWKATPALPEAGGQGFSELGPSG